MLTWELKAEWWANPIAALAENASVIFTFGEEKLLDIGVSSKIYATCSIPSKDILCFFDFLISETLRPALSRKTHLCIMEKIENF